MCGLLINWRLRIMKFEIFSKNAKLADEFMVALAKCEKNNILGYILTIGDTWYFEAEVFFKDEINCLAILIENAYGKDTPKYNWWMHHTLEYELC